MREVGGNGGEESGREINISKKARYFLSRWTDKKGWEPVGLVISDLRSYRTK